MNEPEKNQGDDDEGMTLSEMLMEAANVLSSVEGQFCPKHAGAEINIVVNLCSRVLMHLSDAVGQQMLEDAEAAEKRAPDAP